MSAAPFITNREAEHRRSFSGEGPSALVINPEADVRALVAAAAGWAQTVRRTMTAWACVTEAGLTDAQELGFLLEPMTQLVEQLLDEIGSQLAAEDHVAESGQSILLHPAPPPVQAHQTGSASATRKTAKEAACPQQ